MQLRQRAELAGRLRQARNQVAAQVTAEFFERHPDWLARYGENGKLRGTEDAAFHIDFLAAAIESGSPAAFSDYARWTTRVLKARGMSADDLQQNLRQIGDAYRGRVSDVEHGHLSGFIQGACQACAEQDGDPESTGAPRLELSCRLFTETILQGNRRAAVNIALEVIRAGSTLIDLYADVFQPALFEVGRRWEQNEIVVAEEHMATAVTQYVMAEVYQRSEPSTSQRGKALVTGVEQELHHIGANMVADALESHGWEVRFLGCNVPHAGILKIIDDTRPDAIGISATMLFNVPRVISLIKRVREEYGIHCPRVVVGGAAFRSAPELWSEIGADGFAPDVRAAIQAFDPDFRG